MAELAAGAVSGLLGVIRNEMTLLGGVRDDVQFIKEEMESMSSFLMHLARMAPPGGEHDEQVRTWMNQVRVLAQDCNNCIDLYLYRGNPDIHRARGGLRRYLWWAPWFLHKLFAQHRAAIQLRRLKDRARDVGKRRLRYGVKAPAELALGYSPAAAGLVAAGAGGDAAGDDDGEDGGDQLELVVTVTNHFGSRAFFQPRTLDEYVKVKLLEWSSDIPKRAIKALSIAIVAPDTDQEALLALAHETLVVYYQLGVLVDIPSVHHDFVPLRPKEVLFYILQKLQPQHSKPQLQQQDTSFGQDYYSKWDTYYEKKRMLHKIKENIKEMKIYEKLDKIKSDIQVQPLKGDQLQQLLQHNLEKKTGVEDYLDLDILLQLLLQSAAAASQQDKGKNKDMHKLAAWYDGIITKLAKKLKEFMEADGKADKLMEAEEKEETTKNTAAGEEAIARRQTAPIRLHESQYEHILRGVFQKTTSSKPLQAQQQDRLAIKKGTKTTTTILGGDQINQMIQEAKQEILRELQEGKGDKNQATGEPGGPRPKLEALEDMEQKMDKIKKELKEQLKIKGLVDEIKHHLKDDTPLIGLKVDEIMDGSRWEDTRNALSLLECSADALIITSTKDTQRAKGFCYPLREPIDYSLVGLYNHTVLELTSQQKDEDSYNPQIFLRILEECEPHEFCMKIFTHALYANPKRSNEELSKLHNNLQASPKSLDIAKKMFNFSYSDLPKEFKSCLLYLAIFPSGHKIRRSTLIGRWVTEGLIFQEDWPSSVSRANRCFDELINRWLVYPANVGAAGKVKSCMVGHLIHGFITKIARKQHIVDTRLSHRLARHFSIFNDLRLRNSDGINVFFQGLSESSRVSLLKVLDLEGCQCFGGEKQRYLKVICSKMLLLKYLSLRGTDVTELPTKINNLRELEVLDIRQTKVPESATVNVLLLKLKRLLAGHIYMSPRSSNTDTIIGDDEITGVQIPDKIEKMVNMEVLSNVKAQNSQDLKDIGRLCQLRKLGVIIDDKDNHLRNLLRTISDLSETLHSLSITLPIARREGTPSSGELQADNGCHLILRHPPKLLESLSISGTTKKGCLFALFAKDGNSKLAKVTLSRTLLNQDNLKVLANMPKLRCVRLRHIICAESMLTFEKDEFKYLKYLLIEGSNWTEIIFKNGAARELEKMVLSFTNIMSIHGADSLKKLEELELNNNNNGRLLSLFDNAKQIAKLTLHGTFLEQADLQILANRPNIYCLELLDNSCVVSQITLKKDDFPKLNFLTVDCSSINEIIFTSGAGPKLEKIICSSFTTLSGINQLSRLKELDFNGDRNPEEVEEAIRKTNRRLHLKHNQPENQATGDERADDDAARCSFFWKKQV